MPMTVQELHAETRKLTSEQVAELMDLLLADSVTRPDPEIEKAWGETALRRLEEIESGKVKPIPGEEVMARARKIIGR